MPQQLCSVRVKLEVCPECYVDRQICQFHYDILCVRFCNRYFNYQNVLFYTTFQDENSKKKNNQYDNANKLHNVVVLINVVINVVIINVVLIGRKLCLAKYLKRFLSTI